MRKLGTFATLTIVLGLLALLPLAHATRNMRRVFRSGKIWLGTPALLNAFLAILSPPDATIASSICVADAKAP